MVGDVEFDETEAFTEGELREAVTLQRDRIVVVEVVDTGDGDALVKQRVGDVKADETGGAGQKDVLGTGCLHGRYP